MPMTLVVVLNVVMSLLAFGAVAVGVLIARRLSPGAPNQGGRAHRRGPSSRLRPPVRAPQMVLSIATATNSSAR